MAIKSMTKEDKDDIQARFGGLHTSLLLFKPNDRSERDKNFAIALTELKKLCAFVEVHLLSD